MDHLREHPNFVSLPKPQSIKQIQNVEDVRQFRQDSWQWDALHAGRCTTSQAVAALGFLEPKAGHILGIPKSWQRGGSGAYYRLRQQPLRTLDEMNDELCSEYDPKIVNSVIAPTANPSNNGTFLDSTYWSIPVEPATTKDRQKPKTKFVATYNMKIDTQEKERRRRLSQKITESRGSDNAIRLMWGNTQESTALLAALNYFANDDRGVVLREVGMCGAGLRHNISSTTSSLLVGASPDGLLSYPNGDIEVVEVKNHCPYSTAYNHRRHKTNRQSANVHAKGRKRFRFQDFVFHSKGIQIQYVPQLQMEMLCVGENCRSAVMVRLTATNGARILRMKRDDGWIEEMMYWLHKFQSEFVEKEDLPPQNFFCQDDDPPEEKERYLRFLEWTKEIALKVDLLAHVPNSEIQRAVGTVPGNTPLFLD